MRYYFDDFTEENYRRLLKLARTHYRFVSFPEHRAEGTVCIWRHDVDLSIHRALRLASIEADEGVPATFFVHLQNPFYNALEREIVVHLRRIAALGHHIGVHFDPAYHFELEDYDLEAALAREQRLLADLIDEPVRAFSIHNPDQFRGEALERDEIHGMVNAYGPALIDGFAYCSDSNGYWRYERLEEVLSTSPPDRLHVLTHPGWWTPEVMTPHDRVLRCIEGRATRQRADYAAFLRMAGRENVGGPD